MRTLLALSALVSLVACGGEATSSKSATAPQPPAAKPHVVLISIDTLRADHLGCYGYGRNTSPELDRFAESSVVFERAISQAAVTAPAHMSMFTGLTPAVHGVYNHTADGREVIALSPAVPTLAEILKANGYRTLGFNGGGNVSAPMGFGRGFDIYDSETVEWFKLRENADGLAPVRAAIDARDEDQPVFLFLHHYACHDPYVRAPEVDRLRFLEDPVEGLITSPEEIMERPEGMGASQFYWQDIELQDPRHLAQVLALYDGCIYYSDWVFGRIEAMLRDAGIWDDALVFVVSDHGEEFNEHGGKLHWRLFVETLHVPFLVKFPGGKHAGARVTEATRSFDLMPTILESAGVPVSDAIQATSLLPLLAEGTYDAPILSYANQKPDTAVRIQGKAYTYSNQRSAKLREWLFDSVKDPRELENLADTGTKVLPAMRQYARRILDGDGELRTSLGADQTGGEMPSEDLTEQLKNLGYVK